MESQLVTHPSLHFTRAFHYCLEQTAIINLLKVGGQVGPQLDDQVPPDVDLGEEQRLRLHLDGAERQHDEL